MLWKFLLQGFSTVLFGEVGVWSKTLESNKLFLTISALWVPWKFAETWEVQWIWKLKFKTSFHQNLRAKNNKRHLQIVELFLSKNFENVFLNNLRKIWKVKFKLKSLVKGTFFKKFHCVELFSNLYEKQ